MAIRCIKNFDDKFSRLGTILDRDRQTESRSRGVDPGGPVDPPPNILLKGPCINRAPPIIKLQHVITRKLCYRKDDRAMRAI